MPRTGGEADKFGNRYEGLWVVDAALDLIDDEYVDLVVEAVGDEAAGVEFFGTNPSGTREYHSVKRQQAGGNWTVSRLTQGKPPSGRSILGDLIQKVQEGAVGVFSSGTSASELVNLLESALPSESHEEFQTRISENALLSGCFYKYIVPICGDAEAAYFVLRHLRVRTKLESDLAKDIERRIRSMFRMQTGAPPDTTAVRLLMADFATSMLSARLTADSFLSFLCGHDILLSRLSGHSTAGTQMQRLNRLYLREVDALLINRAEINREESTAAYSELLENGKSVMLEGTAGGGKSCVVAQIVKQLDSHDIPTLVIRLDSLTEADHSAQAVGVRRELPDSPTITLGELAGDQPSVLCIDQLDALSIVSARQQSAWNALDELLDEARNYPNMRILFACRSFDLEQDAQLRAFVADEETVTRIRVGELSDDTIQSAIESSGLAVSPLDHQQMRLLSVPLHLYLFLEAARSGDFDFTSKGDLFDAFWRHKARNVNNRLGAWSSVWTETIAALCDVMSERESLVAPDYALDEWPEAIEAMASEAVVQVQDGEIRFFHESFFDYSFARSFLRTNSDLVGWLESDQQHLFRRSQVRQVLTFLRDRESDRPRYLQTLSALLGHSGIRFHIKKLVLDWLHALPDPTREEWDIVDGLVDQLDGHAWQMVSNSVPWFDVLQATERWEAWLNADEEIVNWTMLLLMMPEVLGARSATVASLIGPFRGRSANWRLRLQRLVERGSVYTSPEMEDLVIALIQDGTLDTATGFAVNSDWWSVWYMTSTQEPAFTVRVLGAWFDRQLGRADELDLDDPFSRSLELVAYSQFSEHVISESAKRAPREFVLEMFPRFAKFDKRVPKEWIAGPSAFGIPDDQLRDALAEAMMSLAIADPAELDSIMGAETLGDTKWMDSLVLRAWSSNPDHYGEHIVRYLMARPDKRLDIGYNVSAVGADIFAAVSRTAVAAASASCSDASFIELENAIRNIAPEWERERGREGLTELVLLRALAQERVREDARQRIQELERRFPNAPQRGAPQPHTREHKAQRARAPIAEEIQQHMSDAQWLSAMAQHTGDSRTFVGEQFVGGAMELSQDLKKLVAKNPERFSALVNQMEATLPPTYFEAILKGLSDNGNGSGRAGTLEQVCSVLRRIRDLGVQVHGVEVGWAIGALSEEALPDDIVQMLCRVALDDRDPESDDWHRARDEESPIDQAINSARGAAATALSRLLSADRSRWNILKPTIGHLVEDRVLAVRSVAVESLLAILDTHRSDAFAYFKRLAEGAGPILGTRYVERFIHYAIFRDYPAVRPILMSMLKSSEPHVVQAGARQISLAALWVDEARGDEAVVLEMGEEARAGAATVYAGNLSDQTVGADCEKHLRTLFEDESDLVRREASSCWVHLQPDQIASRGSLIGAFAHSLDSARDVSLLAYRLKDARRPLPAEVCVVAERALAAFGSKETSIQNEEAGVAGELAVLMVRLHEQTNDPVLRQRVLNTIDEMIRAGFYGIDEQLRQQYDR
jgi:hypothetical protein